MTDANLELDLETPPREGTTVARIRLGFARGYARDGSPLLTLDCATPRELEREIERLGEELAAALDQARQQLAGAPPAPTADGGASADATTAKHIDSDLSVADVMTRDVRSVGRNDALRVAEGLMQAGRFRHTVVLDDDGTVAGVLSQSDFVFNTLSWQLGQGSRANERALETIVAKDLMRAPAITIDSEAPLGEAARLMTEHKIGCLPVVEGPSLVGIITEGDFLALLAPSGS